MLIFLYLSITLFIIWVGLYLLRPNLRKEMLFGSLIAFPFGITEVFFVPEYWKPETLFHLAPVDIESFLFLFAVGGIAAVSSEIWRKAYHRPYCSCVPHKNAFSVISFTILLFLLFMWLFPVNVIYPAIIALFAGAIAIGFLRGDLWNEISRGLIIFMLIYAAVFTLSRLFYPPMIDYWNLKDLTGVMIFAIPLEELLWAASFGAFWSPFYEYVFSNSIERKSKKWKKY